MPEEEKNSPKPLSIVSLVVLFFAACLFFYIAFYQTAEQNKKLFNSITHKIEVELSETSEAQIKKIEESKIEQDQQIQPDSQAIQVPISNVPTFLQKINNETIASGTELSNVKKVDDHTYKLTVDAPFYRLVDFLFKIEQSNLAVQAMDIHPFSNRKNLINITLRVIQNEMSEDNLQTINEFEKKYTGITRDPFRKGMGPDEIAGPSDIIDLTWEFKLTGIGFDKGKFANIDHKNYRKGDTFNGMRITGIHRDRVDLQSGPMKFFIFFRKPGKKK